ncbi:efflux RND transporter permease subunit [Nodosilinea nodulosa]|uniref:efflux RND transporter permease subunit n=1 Tax=Nodosilinea nodulosa TaxID=416001 RepID=UPI0002F5EC54|nr:efflux RND transporter permease subunit [Nodosilinea nodulosa]
MPQASPPRLLKDRLNLSKLAINHAGLTIAFWLVVSVAGLFAFRSLEYALFPDITFPVVVVNGSAPLATALETEAQLTVPLEAQFEPLEGLNRIFSTTYPGQSVLNLRFKVGTDLEASTAAVEEALAELTLPEATQTQVIPLNLNEEAAISYALGAADGDLVALAERVKADVIPPLEAVPGVLRVDLQGTAGQQTLAPPPLANNQAPGAKNPSTNLLNPPTLIRFNGAEALALQVIKRGSANTLAVVNDVEAVVQNLQAAMPDLQITKAATQANFIQESTQATIDSLVLAIAIAVLVIFWFLRNWRATLIVALAIPTSLLGTFVVMAIYGFNLETITLLALALVIGIIVDDAIVDVENIMRHLEAGESPKQAALRATREIGLTVSVSTLSIVAVFLPVALMGGTVGQFFKPFGLTVSAAVLTSLLVARTLSPVLAVYWLRGRRSELPPEAAGSEDLPPGAPAAASETTAMITEAPPNGWLARRYSRLLGWALGHRWMVVALAIASLVAGIALIPLVPQGFIPQLDRGEFNVTYQAPLPQPGAQGSAASGVLTQQARNPRLAQAAGAAAQINPMQLIFAQSQSVAEQIEATVLQAPAVASVLTTVGVRGKPNQGKLYVTLSPDRALTTAEVQDQLRADLPQIPGVTTSVEDLQFVDTGGEKPLQVVLVGEDLAQLHQAATALKDRVAALPGFVDVSTTEAVGSAGEIVEINRRSGQRVAYVTANLSAGQALGKATDQMVAIANEILPPGVTVDLGGDSARLNEVLGSFGTTLGLAVICMLVVLWIPFGRLLEPAVVGLSLPLALVGAMLALLITQSDFGMISVIGLLFLLGLLDKNALLLMDYINQLREAGLSRDRAIKVTGQVRLRPILMTTASTVLGMVPIALGLGAGAELRQPMAVAIIGGLITSTLLSLVVVPVLYTLLEDGWQRLSKR